MERPNADITWRALLRDTYLTMDRRTLGFSRLVLGFLLLCDLARRTPDWLDMYSAEGVLPSHINLLRPQSDGFSIFNAFSTPGELWFLWAIGLVTYMCLFVGYRTRVAQVAALIFVTSMNGRVLLIENGGYVVQNLLLLWTCFLPMGDRFSVDALLASMRRARETTAEALDDRSNVLDPERAKPHVSFVSAVILLQLTAVYFFNVVHKTGPAWKNGTAVHYVIYVDRMVTPWVAAVRDHVPDGVVILLTKGTLAIEAALPILLLSPLARVWSRRAVIVLMNALHIGFGSVFTLGPFAWSCCTFSTLMFSAEDWDLAARTMRRPARARTILFDPAAPLALGICRVMKRLDRFELLSFRERRGGAVLSVEGASRPSVAIAEALAALPLGPLVAWIPRLPGLCSVVDASIRRLDPGAVAAFLGLSPRRGRVPPLPRRARVIPWLREAAVLVMFAAALSQASVELWVMRRFGFHQPEAMLVLSHKMRFLQGWFMFSPNPVMDDGTVVTDAVTVDGRHIDPFTGTLPDFDLTDAKSLRLSQIWGDYFNRIHLPQNAFYRDAMKEYILRYPKRTGRPEDAIVSAEIFWVHDINPKWRSTRSFDLERTRLFGFDTRSRTSDTKLSAR